MNRVYKIVDLTLYINASIKTLPYNVWRDIANLSYSSFDFHFGQCEEYKFASLKQLNEAVEVLNGAMFSEVSVPKWQEIIDACLTDKE